MQETVKQRLIQFLKYKGLSQKKFEEVVGLSNGYINNLKESPSSVKIQKIFDTFPELSKDWVLTGEGEMLNDTTTTASSAPTSTEAYGALLRMFEAYQTSTAKFQEQIDRLIALLEKSSQYLTSRAG